MIQIPPCLSLKHVNKLLEVKHDTSCMMDRKHNSLQRYWRGKWGRGARAASTVEAYWGFVVITHNRILTRYCMFLFCSYTIRSNLLHKLIYIIFIHNENRFCCICHASNKIDSTALSKKHLPFPPLYFFSLRKKIEPSQKSVICESISG